MEINKSVSNLSTIAKRTGVTREGIRYLITHASKNGLIEGYHFTADKEQGKKYKSYYVFTAPFLDWFYARKK